MSFKLSSKTVSKMTVFRKNANCPASEKLLAFQNSELTGHDQNKITVHLRFCEFCASEIELYTHYPQAEDLCEKTEIPLPLYELAEALLNNKKKDSFEKLFISNLTD